VAIENDLPAKADQDQVRKVYIFGLKEAAIGRQKRSAKQIIRKLLDLSQRDAH
jgi:hypothetical protein